jgi:hypothetical protein
VLSAHQTGKRIYSNVISMSRRPCTFRETDVKRAVKAVRAAGVEIARVEIGRDGRIIVVPGKPRETEDANGERNEWDAVHGQLTPSLRP